MKCHRPPKRRPVFGLFYGVMAALLAAVFSLPQQQDLVWLVILAIACTLVPFTLTWIRRYEAGSSSLPLDLIGLVGRFLVNFMTLFSCGCASHATPPTQDGTRSVVSDGDMLPLPNRLAQRLLGFGFVFGR